MSSAYQEFKDATNKILSENGLDWQTLGNTISVVAGNIMGLIGSAEKEANTEQATLISHLKSFGSVGDSNMT
jgi:hypothetical protein